jgi:protein TonB
MSSGRAIRTDSIGTPDAAPDLDLTNVVPFARRAAPPARAAPEISVAPSDRSRGPTASTRARLAALIICSAAAHAALYLPFAREPEPMASLGEMVITAEIVIGTNTPEGTVDEQGQAQASAPEPARTPDPAPDRQATELADARPPEPDGAASEPAPHVQPAPATTEQRVAALPQTAEQPAVKPQAPIEPEPDASPNPPTAIDNIPPALPEAKPLPAPPRQTTRPAPKTPEKPKAETRRAALGGPPNQQRSTAPASTSAAGAGRGRSDLSSNYAGLVAAHLARFKQFPPDARSRGDQGGASVTFSLSGGGGVTSVRLTRGTGVASLDAEATAMVRRASPFPPPPDGRPQSFTVPVSFRLN